MGGGREGGGVVVRGKRISKGGKSEEGASVTEGDGGKLGFSVVGFQGFYFSDCFNEQLTARSEVT